jgi:hypothetical protein
MRSLRALHKWMALLLFLQVLVWIGSGLIISLMDAAIAAGNTSRGDPAPAAPLAGEDLLAIDALALERGGLQSVHLSRIDGLPVYRLRYAQGVRLLDARTGAVVVVDREMAQRIAMQSYRDSGAIIRVERVDRPAELVSFEGPAWRVDFDDSLGTRAYVDASDGRLLGHRNDRSALLEFLLKLHFMDYDGGRDFNHPLIITVAFATLWLTVSGALLLIASLRRVGLE